mgnify:FL=1
MDQNNNDLPNPNLFLGRAVPFGERALERFECRLCYDMVANIHRHERLCPGIVKRYRCNVCRTSFNDDSRCRAHFRKHHRDEPMPANFLNPVFRHRRAGQHVAAPAPPAPPQAPPPVEAQVAPVDVAEVVEVVQLPIQELPAPEEGGAAPLVQHGEAQAIGLLLRANLAANIVQVREALGNDLAVIALVTNILNDPQQFLLN